MQVKLYQIGNDLYVYSTETDEKYIRRFYKYQVYVNMSYDRFEDEALNGWFREIISIKDVPYSDREFIPYTTDEPGMPKDYIKGVSINDFFCC